MNRRGFFGLVAAAFIPRPAQPPAPPVTTITFDGKAFARAFVEDRKIGVRMYLDTPPQRYDILHGHGSVIRLNTPSRFRGEMTK